MSGIRDTLSGIVGRAEERYNAFVERHRPEVAIASAAVTAVTVGAVALKGELIDFITPGSLGDVVDDFQDPRRLAIAAALAVLITTLPPEVAKQLSTSVRGRFGYNAETQADNVRAVTSEGRDNGTAI